MVKLIESNGEYMRKIIRDLIPKYFKDFIKIFRSGNYFYFLWLFPIKGDKIVICNYYGKGYGDNGKYIVENIIKNNIRCEIIWLLRGDLDVKSKFPDEVKIVEYGSFRALYELATARVWIDNCRKIYSPPKRKKQYYIQTWHGGIALKRIEKDAQNKLSSLYVRNAKHDSKLANLFVSNSKFCSNLYRSAFWYNGEILECGSPRCDILINKGFEGNNKVRDYYSLDENTNILIYAPTFRVDLNTNSYNLDFFRLIETLERKFGGDWVIFVRLHPNVSSKDSFMKYSPKVINVTDYDDMYELLATSDLLITDYSSSMFEFSFTNKPVFLYAPDIEKYTKDRNFYFDIYSLPYPVAEENTQLIDIIENFNLDAYISNLKVFLSKLDIEENGNASNQVVKKISNIISKC